MAMAVMYHQDPATGLNLIPLPPNLVGAPLPAAGLAATAALKSNSLARMPELGAFLAQCEDANYKSTYYNLLRGCPVDALQDFAQQLRQRAQWLAAEQSLEFKRAKLSNVLVVNPQVPDAAATATAADTFFCNRVLGSVPHGLGSLDDDLDEHVDLSPVPTDGGMAASLVEHQLQRRITPVVGDALEAAVVQQEAERPARPGRQTTLRKRKLDDA